MLWTRDVKHFYWALDSMEHLPAYKKDAHMLYMSGLTDRLLTLYDN